MANDVTHNPLVLDSTGVLSATNRFQIRKIRLIPAAAACTATLKNGAAQIIASLSAVASGAPDEVDFHADPLEVLGLELSAIAGAGAIVHVYCE